MDLVNNMEYYGVGTLTITHHEHRQSSVSALNEAGLQTEYTHQHLSNTLTLFHITGHLLLQLNSFFSY